MSLKRAREVLEIEVEGIRHLRQSLNAQFIAAVECLARCTGRVIVTGMGKTGIIGHKIAATFSSTGTPAIWMHSAEAVHGDLGQVTASDILLLISTSGETEETTRLLPLIKKIGAKIITITGNLKSTLARHSDITLNVAVAKEGCPLGLAPMASTTATLVMGDALAACLIDRKGFRKENFAFLHPGGTLGRRLFLTVGDIMRTGSNLARVSEDCKVKDALLAVTRARCGSACVVNKRGTLKGIFTDGDLRRHIEEDPELLKKPVASVMSKRITTIERDKLAADAYDLLKTKRIDELPVVDKRGRLVGLLDVQDLLRARLV